MSLPRFFLFSIVFLLALAKTAQSRAGEPSIFRLAGEGSFRSLEDKLETAKANPFSRAVSKDIDRAGVLLTKGRLMLSAGRLKQAGFFADQTEALLRLIDIRLKNAALVDEKQKMESEVAALLQRIAALEKELSSVGASAPSEAEPPADAKARTTEVEAAP